MASRTSTHDVLIGHQSPVEAGGELLSTVVDVHNSDEVHIALSTAVANPKLRWGVHFGPTQSGRLTEVASGTFADGPVAPIVVPTYGVRMLVTVHNDGAEATWAEGMVYFVSR